jgi:hypothetical protein
MLNTLNYILNKYSVDPKSESPIDLPYTRNDMAELFKELNFTVGAEIGVDRGLYAETLSKANPGVKLYCIDPWKVYNDYEDLRDPHYMNVNYALTKRRLSPYNCKIIKKSSMGAIKDFEDESLDFVYIDANHDYKYVLEDIEKWSKIVKSGGIVSGHDYVWRSHRRSKNDVKDALNLYMKTNNIKPLFLFGKNSGSTWLFIK